MAVRFVPTREDPPIQVLAAPARERLSPRVRLWRILACCVLMHRTNRAAIMPVWPLVFDRYPAAVDLADTDPVARPITHRYHHLIGILEPLGFQERRTRMLITLANALHTDARRVLSGDLLVEELPGCGEYAREAYDLFVLGDLTREPRDHVLAAWRRVLMDAPAGPCHDRRGRQGPAPMTVGDTRHKEHHSVTTTTDAPRRAEPTQRIKDALVDHGPNAAGDPWDAHLTSEQIARAWEAKASKRGLRGKALAEFILTGDGIAEQAAKAPKAPKAPRAKSATSRKSKYPPEIGQAVQRAYELMGKSHGPGPKQHVAVRKAIGNADPVKATGFASLPKLTAFAKGDAGKLTEQTLKVREAMRALFEASGADSFARGRHLACIVVAYAEQQRAAK